MAVDEAPAREIVEAGESIDGTVWDQFAPELMAHLHGLLPDGLVPLLRPGASSRLGAYSHLLPSSALYGAT